jgi:EAL domain-containing protein (putative c-di-GMP-specific phosphodiesterase class I)
MEPLDLLREADLAMYQAKSGGGNQLAVFEPTLRPEAARRFETQQALSHCLERDELVLEYQPIIRLSDGQVVGAEALLRWDRPGHGLTYPDGFVPILEGTGLIVPVGGWVLRTALTQLSEWRRTGAVSDDFCLAVNLSVRQLSHHVLVQELTSLMRDLALPAATLTLEVTETAAMAAQTEITAALDEIAALGVGLTIDDFGTGYSSLSLLRSLPVTQLKVDALFVAGLLPGERHDGLAAAVVRLAHQFRLTCLAEGVESPQQLARLRELGCDLAQGFHLGMPIAAEEFARVHQTT